MSRVTRALAGAAQAMLAGAFFWLAVARLLVHPQQDERVGALVLGAVYGLAVLGIVRLFRVEPWGYWIAGLCAGPVPAALALKDSVPQDERAGLWILTAILGLLIGGLECARLSRERRDPPRA